MKKFKIFFGAHALDEESADEKANKWLDEHPNIEIFQMKYQQARYGDHSICIMYEELEKEEDAPVLVPMYVAQDTNQMIFRCPRCQSMFTYPTVVIGNGIQCSNCKKGKSS